ncbi:unnamed protein product [Ectocarpus sp. 8 AP-2014]
MSAVQSRRLEVYLVKVEQQLQEEAAMRLVQREARINLEVERSCMALAAERDERVSGVAAVKDNLRGKLEQLSTMYEEVSMRMDNLEKAYAQAESELKDRALADQRKAVEREDRGVRRRVRAIMLEHGGKAAAAAAATAGGGNGDAASCGEPSRGASEDREGFDEPWFFATQDDNSGGYLTAAAAHQAPSPSASTAEEEHQQLFQQQKLKKLEQLQHLQRQRAAKAAKANKDRRRSVGSVGSIGSAGSDGAAFTSGVGAAATAARQRRRRASVENPF